MCNIVAIIQARMGSSRLPGKCLKKLADKSLLEHIVERVKASKWINNIVIATTNLPEDDPIAMTGQKNSIHVTRGSSEDVLSRFFQAATEIKATTIVRVTADDPFKDPDVIDLAICKYNALALDYCSNTIELSYPEGLDVEVFSMDALRRANEEARLKSEREHVTPYIWKNPKQFKIGQILNPEDHSDLRWTIDYPEDLQFAISVYRGLYKDNTIFRYKDILSFLSQTESTRSISNCGIPRNLSYRKQIQNEE